MSSVRRKRRVSTQTRRKKTAANAFEEKESDLWFAFRLALVGPISQSNAIETKDDIDITHQHSHQHSHDHQENRRVKNSKHDVDESTLREFPMCRLVHSDSPAMDMLHDLEQTSSMRDRIVRIFMNEFGLVNDFEKDKNKITPAVIKRMIEIIDKEAFKGELLRLMKYRDITMKYGIEHKPKENHSAIIYYESSKRVQIAVNLSNYSDCIGQINNGIHVRSWLENIEIDVAHEMTHALDYGCHMRIADDAHGPAFANANRFFHGHTKTYIQMT